MTIYYHPSASIEAYNNYSWNSIVKRPHSVRMKYLTKLGATTFYTCSATQRRPRINYSKSRNKLWKWTLLDVEKIGLQMMLKFVPLCLEKEADMTLCFFKCCSHNNRRITAFSLTIFLQSREEFTSSHAWRPGRPKSFRDNPTAEVTLDFFQGAVRHVPYRHLVENNGAWASGHLTHSQIFGKCWSRHWCCCSCRGNGGSYAGTCQSTPRAQFLLLEGHIVNATRICSSPHVLILLADVSR
jgi:hypothetical protein